MILNRYRVFARDPRSGNTATVVRLDTAVATETLQAVAAAEPSLTTVFVTGTELRFFTATSEMSLCSHGLLAAARYVLDEQAASTVTLTAGERAIAVSRDGDTVTMEAGRYVERPLPVPAAELWDVLGVDDAARDLDAPCVVGSIGSPKFLVPVRTRAALLAARLDLDRLRALSRAHGVNGMYAYSRDVERATSIACARGSNPAVGVVEDPATGIAAGALCAALAARGIGGNPYVVEQGDVLGQRNAIHVSVDSGLVGVGGRVDSTGSEPR
jgi:PhzF family phenazine biosynthesis protein